MKTFLLSIALLFSTTTIGLSQNMDNEKLGEIFELLSDTIIGGPGNWRMMIADVPMICITDQFANRMRIVSPIKPVADSSDEEIMACMEANFHTSLDVRYSISEGIICTAFIHPLAELTDEQVLDAIAQIYAASKTYGTEYTSTNFVFPKKEEGNKRRVKKN